MRYFPNDQDTNQAMLNKIGVDQVSDLFTSIPKSIQLDRPLDISAPRSEFSLLKELKEKASSYPVGHSSFLGGGVYRRFIPAAVGALASRAEFLTAYTPYQPEISQGSLQAMFEFQSLLTLLTGMDVANASMYEAASGVAEAVMMASRIRPKAKKVLVSAGLHPEYLEVLKTYLAPGDLQLVQVPVTPSGQTDLEALANLLDSDSLCSILQVINFFGVIEDQAKHQQALEGSKTLNISVMSDLSALGLLKPPGDFGADIFVGEAQSLGLPLSYGGPNLGVFACKNAYLRKMPGRLVGLSEDTHGKRAFCLTLSTREQHIRREKATSNICSNQAHCALWVTIYLSLLGEQGIRELAELNLGLADYAATQISEKTRIKRRFTGSVYNEFVLDLPCNATLWIDKLMQEGILAGVDLSRFDQSDEGGLLVCFTETNSKEEIDLLVSKLGELA